MIQWLLKKIIGGRSKRYRFMVVYLILFVTLTLFDKIDRYTFGIFTTAVMSWLGVETIKKGKD